MTWFKVDDGFAFHPKAIMAGNAALGLWVRAGAWCSANLTDGALPKHMIGTLGAQARDARKLCAVGLWVETETGYQFHDWESMQPTKADVQAEREANRLRQKEYRKRKRNGVTNTVTNGVTNGAPSRPVPTRPKDIEEPSGSSMHAPTPLAVPTRFRPDGNSLAWAKANHAAVDLKAETRKFIDWHLAHGTESRNWDASWRNWIAKATEIMASRPQPEKSMWDTLPKVYADPNNPDDAYLFEQLGTPVFGEGAGAKLFGDS